MKMLNICSVMTDFAPIARDYDKTALRPLVCFT